MDILVTVMLLVWWEGTLMGGLVGANRGFETGRESTILTALLWAGKGTTCIGGLVGGNYEKATITKCLLWA